MPMPPQSVRYVVRFTGHVQGVGFRATTLLVSRGLDLHGYVRNETDGSVKLDVEGPESNLKELVRRIQDAMRERIDDTRIDQRPVSNRTGGFHIA